MIDVTLWKVRKPDETILAQVLRCEPYVDGGKAVHKALNGAIYIQSIGSGSEKLKLKILCESLHTKYEMDLMNDGGYLLSVVYRGIKYFGYIEEKLISWTPEVPGEMYSGTCTFVIDHQEATL